MHRYGAAYSTWPTPTRSGDHIRSWCGGHYQHSGRDAAKVGVSQRTRGVAPLTLRAGVVNHRVPPYDAASQRHEHSRHAGLSLRGLASGVGCQCRCHNSSTNTGRERRGSGQPLAQGLRQKAQRCWDSHGEGAAAHLAAAPLPTWPRVEAPHLASHAGRQPLVPVRWLSPWPWRSAN